jgi:AAA domain
MGELPVSGTALGWDYLLARAPHYRAQEDFSDELPEELTGSTKTDPKSGRAPRTYKYILLGDIATLPDVNDFVEDVLCESQLSVIFGDANVGKTFIVFDLAMRVARGDRWSQKQTERGLVVFIAGEGAGGMGRRIAAYLKHHGIADPSSLPFALIPETINFRDPQAIKDFIVTLQEISGRFGMPVRWIIVDTLSRALAGGNENAPDDMGALVRGADRMRNETGAHLSFIHHTGKDETKGARGHSLLRAAVDTEIAIRRVQDAHGAISVTVTKQRDLEIGVPITFRLAAVELGTNRRGKPVTSCVVEEATIRPELSKSEQEAVQILQTMLMESDAMHVKLTAWRSAVMSRKGLLTGQSADTNKKQWQRLRKSLEKKAIIAVSGDDVWTKHG